MIKKISFSLFLIALAVLTNAASVSAQDIKGGSAVELNGDVVEYSVDGNVVTAKGNVVIKYNEVVLYCDQVEFFQTDKKANALGNVRLVSNQGEFSGEKLSYDFKTNQGEFNGAKILANPYFGYGDKVRKVGENQIIAQDGYLTTSDYDKPEYRLTSKKIEVYPGDKLIARNIFMKIGSVPIMYFPWYKHRLDDKKPFVTFTPGHESDWGTFLLSNWRYYITDNFKGNVHLDWRERLGFGSGVDFDYNTDMGKGILKTYYTNERTTADEIDRYKVEWRHKWDIDEKTDAIWQYYKLSDGDFLKDYFEREFDKDASPDTFFLLTRQLTRAILSFRSDVRANDYESEVERLPEVRYDLTNTELADSGFYLKNITTFSNLYEKAADPSDDRFDTLRFDVFNEVSYPTKLSIIELKPYVGGRHTYYSNTLDSRQDDAVRGIFEAGTSMATHFYRIFDVHVNKMGLEVNRLRHIITPSISYVFRNEPTLLRTQINSFDSIDEIEGAHKFVYAVENKLQTKREDKTVDLLRSIVSTDYGFTEDPSGSGFQTISADVDFRPTEWLTFYFDSVYDIKPGHLDTANFDMYINGEKWNVGIGKRFNREVDDQITAFLKYRLNQKWQFQLYERFDVDGGGLEEQELTVTRDLHSWEMDVTISDSKTEGSEFLLLFRLKAFPDIGVDFGTNFNKQDSGSTSLDDD